MRGWQPSTGRVLPRDCPVGGADWGGCGGGCGFQGGRAGATCHVHGAQGTMTCCVGHILNWSARVHDVILCRSVSVVCRFAVVFIQFAVP